MDTDRAILLRIEAGQKALDSKLDMVIWLFDEMLRQLADEEDEGPAMDLDGNLAGEERDTKEGL